MFDKNTFYSYGFKKKMVFVYGKGELGLSELGGTALFSRLCPPRNHQVIVLALQARFPPHQGSTSLYLAIYKKSITRGKFLVLNGSKVKVENTNLMLSRDVDILSVISTSSSKSSHYP